LNILLLLAVAAVATVMLVEVLVGIVHPFPVNHLVAEHRLKQQPLSQRGRHIQ
jgi:hypothetical protein